MAIALYRTGRRCHWFSPPQHITPPPYTLSPTPHHPPTPSHPHHTTPLHPLAHTTPSPYTLSPPTPPDATGSPSRSRHQNHTAPPARCHSHHSTPMYDQSPQPFLHLCFLILLETSTYVSTCTVAIVLYSNGRKCHWSSVSFIIVKRIPWPRTKHSVTRKVMLCGLCSVRGVPLSGMPVAQVCCKDCC